MARIWVAFVLGQLVGLLGWVDALFIPLVLLAPLVVGALAAAAWAVTSLVTRRRASTA